MSSKTKLLFGGSSGWSSQDWIASDDRVRGGRSQSHLSCSPGDLNAKFYGNLDIDALGGAGFASQRTASDDLSLNLSEYDGIELVISGADIKKYTMILKDTLLPQSDGGREQATVSWEYDFHVSCSHSLNVQLLIRIPFSDFKPTYRGKPKDGAMPLDKGSIKRLSFMVRSFFGSQKGPFGMTLASVSAFKGDKMDPLREAQEQMSASSDSRFPYPYKDFPSYQQHDCAGEKQLEPGAEKPEKGGWWSCGLLRR